MAKDYDKFKSEWAVVKKEITKGLEDIKKNAQHVAQTSGVITEGTKELGRRVQELKDQGRQGDELKDFLDDREVKQMSDSINQFLLSLDSELKRVDTLHKGSWVKTKDKFWKLRKELEAEIKTRKKSLSTKLGTGNKSLPNMEALLKEIDKVKDRDFTTFDAFTPETIAQHRKETGFKIQDEIRKAKNVRLSEYQKMMMEQGLNTRNIQQSFVKAKSLYQELLKAAQETKTLNSTISPNTPSSPGRVSNSNEVQAAKKTVKQLHDELIKIAQLYEEAPKDQWIRARIQSSKDRSKIESAIKSFIQMKLKAVDTLDEINKL